MRRLGFALLATSIFLSQELRAQSAFWSRAKDPSCAASERARVQIERLIDTAAGLDIEPQMHRDFALAALSIYELEGSPKACDPHLTLLIADALIDSAQGKERQAIALLQAMLQTAPDSPIASDAWFKIAIAFAKLDEPAAERAAYFSALERAWQPEERAMIYNNLAETEMLLGNLQQSVRDYRRSLALSQRPDQQALAYYGLGVALERSGDLPSAIAAMTTADSIRLPIAYFSVSSALDLPSVFFQPPYDIHYYKALSAMARARGAEDEDERRLESHTALAEFSLYIDAAEADRVPWVHNARLHRTAIERELLRTQTAKKPQRKPSGAALKRNANPRR